MTDNNSPELTTESQLAFSIKYLSFFFLALLALCSTSRAQGPVALDTAFGAGGIRLTDVSTADDEIFSMAVQSDGKIITVGYSDKPQQFALARYLSTGVLDNTFGSNGIAKVPFGSRAFAYDIAIQADGKIVVVGDGDLFAMARFTSSGQLDSTFGTGGKVATSIGNISAAQSVAIQADGKIVLAGHSDDDFAVIRYNGDGTVDNSFGGGSGIVTTDFFGDSDRVGALAVLPDGKIVVAGSSLDLDLNMGFAVARYNVNGTLDASFNGTGMSYVQTSCGVDAMTVLTNGKIFLAGSNEDVILARLNSNGEIDLTYGSNGISNTNVGGTDQAASLVTDLAGRILLGGFTISNGNSDFFLARFSSNGLLDPTFDNGDGIVTTSLGSNDDFAHSLSVQADGRILVGGSSGDFGAKQFGLVRYMELQPTAAPVTVQGKISKSNGQGLNRVFVTITDGQGLNLTAVTNTFGNYIFNNIPAGKTYIITPQSSRDTFQPTNLVLNVTDNVTNANFVAQ